MAARDAQKVVAEVTWAVSTLMPTPQRAVRSLFPSDPVITRAVRLAKEIMYTDSVDLLPASIRPFVLNGKRLKRKRPGAPVAALVPVPPPPWSDAAIMPRTVAVLAELNTAAYDLTAAEWTRTRLRYGLPLSAVRHVHSVLAQGLKRGVPRAVRRRFVAIPNVTRQQMQNLRRLLAQRDLLGVGDSYVESSNADIINALFTRDVLPFKDRCGGRLELTADALHSVRFDVRSGVVRLGLHLSYVWNGEEVWSTAVSQMERLLQPAPNVVLDYNPAFVYRG